MSLSPLEALIFYTDRRLLSFCRNWIKVQFPNNRSGKVILMKAAKRTEIKNLLDFEEEKERPIETKKAFPERD